MKNKQDNSQLKINFSENSGIKSPNSKQKETKVINFDFRDEIYKKILNRK